ncbi:hypothetical protein DFS34DRAFT_698322 [Phlyctochytrium arcticum]|nr:hypothetical protein DFS34DRAFT_698322 [Phlyctochytrium arcticum]
MIAGWVASFPAANVDPEYEIVIHVHFMTDFANAWLKPCKYTDVFGRFAAWIFTAVSILLMTGTFSMDSEANPFWLWVATNNIVAIIKIFDSSDPDVLVTIIIWLFDNIQDWIFLSGPLLPHCIVYLIKQAISSEEGPIAKRLRQKYQRARHQRFLQNRQHPKWSSVNPSALLGVLMASELFPNHAFPDEIKVAASHLLPATIEDCYRPDSASTISTWSKSKLGLDYKEEDTSGFSTASTLVTDIIAKL